MMAKRIIAIAALACALSACVPMFYTVRCSVSRTHDYPNVTYAKANDAANEGAVQTALGAVRAASQEMAEDKEFGGWWPKKETFYEAKDGKIEIDFGFDTAAGYYALVMVNTTTGQINLDVSYVGPSCESGDPKPAARLFAEKISSKLKPKPAEKRKR